MYLCGIPPVAVSDMWKAPVEAFKDNPVLEPLPPQCSAHGQCGDNGAGESPLAQRPQPPPAPEVDPAAARTRCARTWASIWRRPSGSERGNRGNFS